MRLIFLDKHPHTGIITYCPSCHTHSGEVSMYGSHINNRGYICTTKPVTATFRLVPVLDLDEEYRHG